LKIFPFPITDKHLEGSYMSMVVENKVQEQTPSLLHHPGRWVRPKLLPFIFGINPDQARKYRERGIWVEGKQWRYDPIRRVVYCPTEIENWLGGKQ
jgi:hypothetical protein